MMDSSPQYGFLATIRNIQPLNKLFNDQASKLVNKFSFWTRIATLVEHN